MRELLEKAHAEDNKEGSRDEDADDVEFEAPRECPVMLYLTR